MVWGPAKESADKERSALQEFIKEEQGQEGALDEREFQSKIQPWDWRYYAEKVNESFMKLIIVLLLLVLNTTLTLILLHRVCCPPLMVFNPAPT